MNDRAEKSENTESKRHGSWRYKHTRIISVDNDSRAAVRSGIDADRVQMSHIGQYNLWFGPSVVRLELCRVETRSAALLRSNKDHQFSRLRKDRCPVCGASH